MINPGPIPAAAQKNLLRSILKGTAMIEYKLMSNKLTTYVSAVVITPELL